MDPVGFLTVLKDVLISESEEEFEGETYCRVVIFPSEGEEISLKIWKDIEKENQIYSLKIESFEGEILKIIIKAD